jgi:hypothetical protein
MMGEKRVCCGKVLIIRPRRRDFSVIQAEIPKSIEPKSESMPKTTSKRPTLLQVRKNQLADREIDEHSFLGVERCVLR